MGKFCSKCGLQMQEDDFLCPSCGAIWGDRIYRVSKTEEDAQPPENAVVAEPIRTQPTKAKRRVVSWILLGLTVALILGAILAIGAGSGYNKREGQPLPLFLIRCRSWLPTHPLPSAAYPFS